MVEQVGHEWRHSFVLDLVMIQSHKDDIDGDTESDKQLREGVKNDDGEKLREADPDAGAVPHAEDASQLFGVLQGDGLELGAFVLVVVLLALVIILLEEQNFTMKKEK